MPRKRTTAAPNEFTVPCDRIFHWLVQNAGAAEAGDRFVEVTRIYAGQAPGGLISTKAGGAAGALLLMHLVSIERSQSEYHRRVALSCDEDAAEVARLLRRIAKRMVDYRKWARADREAQIKKLGDVFTQSGPGAIHWPSQVAHDMCLTFRALDVALDTARVVRKIARRIPARLIDAGLSDARLGIAEDAALKLADGGFKLAEIAELMDIDEKKTDDPGLKVDRWRKIVERARRKAAPDKRAGTSPSVASPRARGAGSSRAARSAAARSAPPSRRRPRRARR